MHPIKLYFILALNTEIILLTFNRIASTHDIHITHHMNGRSYTFKNDSNVAAVFNASIRATSWSTVSIISKWKFCILKMEINANSNLWNPAISLKVHLCHLFFFIKYTKPQKHILDWIKFLRHRSREGELLCGTLAICTTWRCTLELWKTCLSWIWSCRLSGILQGNWNVTCV